MCRPYRKTILVKPSILLNFLVLLLLHYIARAKDFSFCLMTFDDKMHQSTVQDLQMGQKTANRHDTCGDESVRIPSPSVGEVIINQRLFSSSIGGKCICNNNNLSIVHKRFHLRCDTEYSAHLIFVKFHQKLQKKEDPSVCCHLSTLRFAAQPVNSHPFRQGRRERKRHNERAARLVVLTLVLFCRNRHHYLHCKSRDIVGDILVDPQCLPKEYEGYKEDK